VTTAPGPPRSRFAVWAALVVVVGVALGVGASGGGAPPTPTQRADAIDALVRCPSCEGISVLDSSASTAEAIRQAVAARVRAGQSDQQIDAFLVSRYGPGILLRPPVGGATAWVWVLPPVAVAAAAAGLATVFWRRRRMAVLPVSTEDRALVARAMAERATATGTDARTDASAVPRNDGGDPGGTRARAEPGDRGRGAAVAP